MWSPDPATISTAAARATEAAAVARKEAFPNLEPDRFWFALRAAGYDDDLLAWVASMNDPDNPNCNPVDWAAASAKLEYAKHFERDHPLIQAAADAIGITEVELDALWQFAAV